MITIDDVAFLNLLIARGGTTRILASSPSQEIQALIDQELCTVTLDADSKYKNVSITEQGRNAVFPRADERDPRDTPFFKAGADAARAGIRLQDSALRKLRPGCKEYDWFISGYDSFDPPKSKRR